MAAASSSNSTSSSADDSSEHYDGCLCPCDLWYETDKGTGVGMYATDKALIKENGGYYMCVTDEESIAFNTEERAICDDKCLFESYSSSSSGDGDDDSSENAA